MCKPRIRETQGTMTGGSYTGETHRLDQPAQGGSALGIAAWRGGSPWWILWLIWPVFGVLKAAVPVFWGGLAALSQVTVPLLPLVLIGIVLVLIWRR